MIWLLAGASVLAAIPAGLRWLRVAQREHYLAPSATRFAWRWWTLGAPNFLLALIALIGLLGSLFDLRFGFLVALCQVGPIGLSVQGRTSAVSWTSRMRRLAGIAGGLYLATTIAGVLTGSGLLVSAALFALPAIVDLAMLIAAPIEIALGEKWVDKAGERLESSGAKVVAITGSYGKTSTKQYLHHLLAGSVRVVASPASFNNRMGLARAVNEHLVPGTDVFIAEMGTYGPGEIASLCEWIKPDVAALVSIGPVHLERFKSEERIVEAKSEILDRAERGVIAIDHPLLEALADARATDLEILTVSTQGKEADVSVEGPEIFLRDSPVGVVPDGIFPANLGVAVGVVHALGYEVDASLFESLPRPEHRQSVTTSESGFTIIDDTFNSNPAGAAVALARLAEEGGAKVLVTPGMVELGPLQEAENEAFAEAASALCDRMIIVGGTNRKALLRGAEKGKASVTVVANREAAVEMVRQTLGAGDVVLYENDLPDHYP